MEARQAMHCDVCLRDLFVSASRRSQAGQYEFEDDDRQSRHTQKERGPSVDRVRREPCGDRKRFRARAVHPLKEKKGD